MKNVRFLKPLYFALLLIPVFLPAQNTLYLSTVKDYHTTGAVRSAFFQKLIDFFHVDTFIETGTYLGDTTYNAATLFKHVHTIELGDDLYHAAHERFKDNSNVFVYHGDSVTVLQKIIPTLKGKFLFWLDAHHSGGITAGAERDPLFDEIKSIETSGITNAIILVDDIRGWGPHVHKIRDAILKINSSYTFTIFADIAIAFAPEEDIALSPLLHALTTSRLFNKNNTDIEMVLQAEKIIATAHGNERIALEEIPFSGYYSFWRGLMLLNDEKHKDAQNEFNAAITSGVDPWRISLYASRIKKNQSDSTKIMLK